MTAASRPRFCSDCGTQFLPDARFCHACGASVDGSIHGREPVAAISPMLKWGLPAGAILALVILVFFRMGANTGAPEAQATTAPLGSPAMPDISAMSPEERADRLFNRVMQYWSEGKSDSAAFFAPMAITSIEALTPRTLHLHYDLGLVALASGDLARASAEADTILKGNPTHLLGLALAARVADARSDKSAATAARQKLLASEKSERAKALPEYGDHDSDLRAAIDLARKQ